VIHLKNTLYYYLLSKAELYDLRIEQNERVKYQFKKLAQIPDNPEHTFVFAHFLLTHPPYIYDRNGKFLSHEEESMRGSKQNYTNQLIYTNSLIADLVENILSKNPNSVIILQADEGPYPFVYEPQSTLYKLVRDSKDHLQLKMGVLNAIYLPSKNYDQLHSQTSPVNTFRIIFNEVFGSNYETLSDRSFIYSELYPYQVKEVNIPSK
jgi:hypothetical protein